ncbi:putative leucine-rich repeat domain superfamily [Helianthus debilis subsp. tardiflorus]
MRKVRLLDLSFSPRVDDEVIRLPNLVTCDSLEVLRLFLYKRPLSLPTVTGFPALQVLQLNSVELWDDDSVHQFLKSCPLLEDLSLINCALHAFYDLCISSPSLKTLRIKNTGFIGGSHGLQICSPTICCPKLVLLEYAGHAATLLSIENLDSLKKAVIYPDAAMAHKQLAFKLLAYSMCQLFAGVSHVESLSLNLFFIQVQTNIFMLSALFFVRLYAVSKVA